MHDRIDHSVGLQVHRRIGDQVTAGDPLVTLHCPHPSGELFVDKIRTAIKMSESPVQPRPLILRRIAATE